MNTYEHVLLLLLWSGWCVLHSLLISEWWMSKVSAQSTGIRVWYRALYNVFSVVTLLPILFFQFSIDSDALWEWVWPWQVVQWTGLVAAAVLFIAGARVYDHRSFLGLRQIQSGRDEEVSLRRDGILSSVRHPYYGAGILFLLFWGDGDTANLIMRFVGIVYFLVGSEVEEGKLLRQFGETYDAYKRSTPRFFPSFRRYMKKNPRHGRGSL